MLLVLLGGFCLGLIMMIPAYFVGTKSIKPKIENIDYKERWESAIALLSGDDSIPQEKVKELTSVFDQPNRSNLLSADRRDIALARVAEGLPPDDDLEGMLSKHVKEVTLARIRYGYLRKEDFE